jgi:hypothetical protein
VLIIEQLHWLGTHLSAGDTARLNDLMEAHNSNCTDTHIKRNSLSGISLILVPHSQWLRSVMRLYPNPLTIIHLDPGSEMFAVQEGPRQPVPAVVSGAGCRRGPTGIWSAAFGPLLHSPGLPLVLDFLHLSFNSLFLILMNPSAIITHDIIRSLIVFAVMAFPF